MASHEEAGRHGPDEVLRLHRQITNLLAEIRQRVHGERDGAPVNILGLSLAARAWKKVRRAAGRPSAADEVLRAAEQIEALLHEALRCVESDWQRAQDAISTVVRMQTAHGLAPLFMERKRPYEGNAQLKAMMEDGLLTHRAFLQKPPRMMRFYRRLLFSLDREPTSILEIGVKGGGSTALWKALFPAATVVGMDIKLRHELASAPSEDGVMYLQGDQTDAARLEDIAGQFGPFDVVIDDGSHVTEHQVKTLRCLLPRVRPGGLYVVEDVHASLKQPGSHVSVDYGEDVWADFAAALFQELRKGRPLPATAGGELARELLPMIDDLILGSRVLAIRVSERSAPSQRAT